ncbi:hypothetical protein BC628DRAFT_1419498 [Trametes gibbosa]|nr:hypothetical protein BC628DRAFT_1419498 [Trametes gibbosa]
MPAFTRAVFLGLQAAALVSLVGRPFSLAPSSALAAPVPLPMPLMPHLADYAAQPPARSSAVSDSASTARPQDVAVVSHTTSTSPPTAAHHARADDVDTSILNNINILGNMYSQMSDHSTAMNDLANRAPTEGNSEDFRQDSVSRVTAYKDTVANFQSILLQLGADKGLANYDRSDQLETLLKEILNVNKNTLSTISALVYNVPTLGPILGPIVYDIKCIVDEVTNAVENLTDAVLNALQPFLAPLKRCDGHRADIPDGHVLSDLILM